MSNTTDHTCIKRYLKRHEAELDRALLDSCGLQSIVQADDAGGMQPHLAFGNGSVRLVVGSDIAEEARAVLEQAQ